MRRGVTAVKAKNKVNIIKGANAGIAALAIAHVGAAMRVNEPCPCG